MVKIRLIEAIWSDLAGDNEIESPDWHAEALKRTEKRAEQGLEKPVLWEDAKREIQDTLQYHSSGCMDKIGHF